MLVKYSMHNGFSEEHGAVMSYTEEQVVHKKRGDG